MSVYAERMQRILLSIAALLLSASAEAGEPSIEWTADLAAAQRASATAGRPLLVYLHAAWCAPCKLLEQGALQDAEVHAAAASFVMSKIDADAHVAFGRKHQVAGLPAMLFLDGRGRELMRLQGVVPAEVLVESMRDVSRGYPRYLLDRSRQDGSSLQAAAGYLLQLGNQDAAQRLLDEALAAAANAPPALRESIRFDRAVIALLSDDVDGAAREFDLLSESADAGMKQRALIGLLVSARALKREPDEQRAISSLARHVLGVEMPVD